MTSKPGCFGYLGMSLALDRLFGDGEPPRLGVVHRRCAGRHLDQVASPFGQIRPWVLRCPACLGHVLHAREGAPPTARPKVPPARPNARRRFAAPRQFCCQWCINAVLLRGKPRRWRWMRRPTRTPAATIPRPAEASKPTTTPGTCERDWDDLEQALEGGGLGSFVSRAQYIAGAAQARMSARAAAVVSSRLRIGRGWWE